MVAERSDHGPFGAMDFIGLDTVHDIMTHWADATDDPEAATAALRLKTEFIDRGWLGAKTGVGFYRYPRPAFQDPAFLSAGSAV
jgi:3-hydroxybutyryl-CoA dehydrogenase